MIIEILQQNQLHILSMAMGIIGIGLIYFIIDKISKNDYANSILKEKTLKTLRSEEGANIIKEHAKSATNDTFERAFKAIENVECEQKTTQTSINELMIAFTELKTDVKHILHTLEKFIPKH